MIEDRIMNDEDRVMKRESLMYGGKRE
jgi:hypothetical protein